MAQIIVEIDVQHVGPFDGGVSRTKWPCMKWCHRCLNAALPAENIRLVGLLNNHYYSAIMLWQSGVNIYRRIASSLSMGSRPSAWKSEGGSGRYRVIGKYVKGAGRRNDHQCRDSRHRRVKLNVAREMYRLIGHHAQTLESPILSARLVSSRAKYIK